MFKNYYWGRQEEPAILISRLFLPMRGDSHVRSQHLFGLPLRMNVMHGTQFHHARFDHLSRKTYANHSNGAKAFWPSIIVVHTRLVITSYYLNNSGQTDNTDKYGLLSLIRNSFFHRFILIRIQDFKAWRSKTIDISEIFPNCALFNKGDIKLN